MKKNENLDAYDNAKAVAAYNVEGYRKNESEVFSLPAFGGKILVLGCGTGRSVRLLLENGYTDIVGSDISPMMVEQAVKNIPHIEFQVVDAAAIPFIDASFDTVFFPTNGIDYLYPKENRRRALQEIYRILKPGGLFVFSSHRTVFPRNIYDVYHLLHTILYGRIFTYRYNFQKYGRLLTHYASPKKVRRELTFAGFTLEQVMTPEGSYPTYVAYKPRQ